MSDEKMEAAKAALAEKRSAKTKAAANIREKIAAVQQSVGTIRKNGVNPHFRNRYSTLDEVWSAVKPLLNIHHLAVYCTTSGSGDDWRLTTHIADMDSPEEVCGDFPIPARGTPQQIGSAITYARRYTLCSLLQLITADEDDDGNAASGNQGAAATVSAGDF